jgi:hypothetical protein
MSRMARFGRFGGAVLTAAGLAMAIGTASAAASAGPLAATPAASASDGVGCAPASVATTYSAHLGKYMATVTGIEFESILGQQVPVFKAPLLTVVDPAGRYKVNLGGKSPKGITGLTPSSVGSSSGFSPLCLVRFAGSSVPTVIIGAGGPQVTLVSTSAYVVAAQIGTGGVSKPVTDLSITNGAAGLGGQHLVIAGGNPLLVGDNGAFGYYGAFTVQPPIVANFASGKFVNVTRSHPSLVAASAAGFWKNWLQQEGSKPPATDSALPSLAAWAAVECVAGHQSAAYSKLAALQSAGWISASYVGTTKQQLVRTGYCLA